MPKKSARERGHVAQRPARDTNDRREARRLYEVDGLTLAEIARRKGYRPNTVGEWRKRDGWDRYATVRKATDRAAEKIAGRIAAETGDLQVAAAHEDIEINAEVRRQRKIALRINGRLLDGFAKLVDPVGADEKAPIIVLGEKGSLALDLRRLGFLNLATKLSDDGSGPGPEEGGALSEADEAGVRSVLDEVAREESKGG